MSTIGSGPEPMTFSPAVAPTDARDVVAYWRAAGPTRWFAKDAAFDEDFRTRFLALHQRAAARQFDGWAADAYGALALLILLDQFPRNAFRGTAHMYATDGLARLYARGMLAAGHDAHIEPALRLFCYLPFMHAEDLADQDLCVELCSRLGDASHALRHRDVIARFGRFPHRNPMLGRLTTAEEQAYLDGGGFAG